jgi:chromosome segregation ATPase
MSTSKDRLAAALEAIEAHLCEIDETQAETVGSLEQLREGLHRANNHLGGISGTLLEIEAKLGELKNASAIDLEEIKKLQRYTQSLAGDVRTLTSETSAQYSQLDARVRTTENLMGAQKAASGG